MLDRLKIPKNLRKKIDNELKPGEHIRWVDQPIPRLFTASSSFPFLLGIPFTIVGFVTILQEWSTLEGRIFPTLFSLFFFFVGLGFLLNPILQWQADRDTVYLITDKRAILFKKESSMVIKSYSPEQLNNLYRKEKANGTGNVIVEVEHPKDSDGGRVRQKLGFLAIRNPREVENMLKQLAEKAS